MVMPPLMRPEAPMPDTARLMMNMADDCAAPERAEPSSKMPKKRMKVHCLVRTSDRGGRRG